MPILPAPRTYEYQMGNTMFYKLQTVSVIILKYLVLAVTYFHPSSKYTGV